MSFLDDGFDIPKDIVLVGLYWIPAVVLYFSSLQFVFALWLGIFGYVMGVKDGISAIQHWAHLQHLFLDGHFHTPPSTTTTTTEKEGKKEGMKIIEEEEVIFIPNIVEKFGKSCLPIDTYSSLSKPQLLTAFGRVWNSVLLHFYESHMLSKEEYDHLSFKFKVIFI